MKESETQKAILDYLALKKIFAWRNNTGAQIIRNADGSTRFLRFGKKGSADILGIMPDGKFLAIEVKGKKGVVSLDQTNFLVEIKRNNGVAMVAYSLDDVMKVIETYKTKL